MVADGLNARHASTRFNSALSANSAITPTAAALTWADVNAHRFALTLPSKTARSIWRGALAPNTPHVSSAQATIPVWYHRRHPHHRDTIVLTGRAPLRRNAQRLSPPKSPQISSKAMRAARPCDSIGNVSPSAIPSRERRA